MILELEKVLEQVFVKNGHDKNDCKIKLSNRKELCDYQINSVFKIAKEIKKNPVEVGEGLVKDIKNIENIDYYLKEITFVKPGFINLTLSDSFIADTLNKKIEKGYYEIEKTSNPLTFVVDYGGPNIAKPLHVGHIRPAIIGQSIYEILKAKGHKVISDVHLGDFGLQMGQVIYGLKQRNLKPNDITIELLQEIYPKMSKLCKEDKEVKEICQTITKDLQDGNKEYTEYFKVMYDVSLNDIKRIYKYLGVDFDYWYGERDSYKYIDDLMQFLDKQGVLEEDDGAKIVRVSKQDDRKEMPPLIIQGKSGAYLYATSDMATIYQRMQDFKPNYILYVVDNRQSLYFEQVFRACEISNLTNGTVLEHDAFGTINGKDGKPFKTRSGETLKLEDLIKQTKEIFLSKKETNKDMDEKDIDIIVNAILKYADLQNNRENNYVFDIDKFADVNGKTGPYLLYTAVRIRKIVQENKVLLAKMTNRIYNKYDKDLRMELLKVEDAINNAVQKRMPHFIADYLYNLAVLTNTFYQNNNISRQDDEQIKSDWINLLDYTYKVMEKLLGLLIIEIPSQM